jgi:hypothetical protein
MSYRQILIERHRRAFCDTTEAEILDYMGLRNRDAVNAWIVQQCARIAAGCPYTLTAINFVLRLGTVALLFGMPCNFLPRVSAATGNVEILLRSEL